MSGAFIPVIPALIVRSRNSHLNIEQGRTGKCHPTMFATRSESVGVDLGNVGVQTHHRNVLIQIGSDVLLTSSAPLRAISRLYSSVW